jgi:hypothetical protein
MGIRDRPTAPALPRQNGFAERMIGLIWRRDIDHIVVLTEALAPDLAILWLLLQAFQLQAFDAGGLLHDVLSVKKACGDNLDGIDDRTKVE